MSTAASLCPVRDGAIAPVGTSIGAPGLAVLDAQNVIEMEPLRGAHHDGQREEAGVA
jgi:hypothetical protein